MQCIEVTDRTELGTSPKPTATFDPENYVQLKSKYEKSSLSITDENYFLQMVIHVNFGPL